MKEAVYLFIIFAVGVVFSLHGYFDYGDIGNWFLQTNMMLLKARDAGVSFVELIKKLPTGYYASLNQHTFNYPLSVAAVHIVSSMFGFSPNNIAYVSIATYFATLIISYYLGKILVDREFGFLFSLLLAISPLFNIATRTGSGIFYFTHIFYASCLVFFILAHTVNRSRGSRIGLFFLSACIVAISLFNGYPLSFIALPILVVFFVLFFLCRCCSERFFSKDAFLTQYRVQNLLYYVSFALISVALYIGISLFWDVYTGAEPFTTYKGTVQGTIARSSPTRTTLVDYLHRAQNIFNCLFIDMDKGGYFAEGGTHSDTSYPGQPVLPFALVPFFLWGLFSAIRRPNFTRIFFMAQFGMFLYVMIAPFNGGLAPRVWFPMTFFILLISADGVQQCFFLLRERYRPRIGTLAGVCLLAFIVHNSYGDVRRFADEKVGNKIFMAGLRESLEYIRKQDLGARNLIIFLADEGKVGGISNVYFNNKNKIDTIITYGKQESIFSKEGLIKLLSEYDSVYAIALPPVYLMHNKFGWNFACRGCPNYENFIVNRFPTWVPEKTIYSATMRPLQYILNLKTLLRDLILKIDITKNKNILTHPNPHWNSQRYINGGVVNKSNDSPYDGKYFLAISGEQGSSLIYTFGYPFCKGLYGHNIEFSAWLKAKTPGAAMALDILYLDETERVPSFLFPGATPFHPGDGIWHQAKLQKTFEKEPIAIHLTIFNSGSGKDEINVDLVTMRDDGKDVSNYVPDNSFEEWQENELTDSSSGKYQFLDFGQSDIKMNIFPLKRVTLLGPIKNLSYSQNHRVVDIPINLSENMSAVFSPKKSEVVFYPFTNDENANVFDMKNLVKGKDPSLSYYESNAEESYITFLFKFPFAIKQADITTNPVIFNDREGNTSYSISYSTDGKAFTETLRIQSNSNERYGIKSMNGPGGDSKEPGGPEYNALGEYTNYSVITPDSKELYIKLAFHNKFYSMKTSRLFYSDRSTMFRFLLDTGKFFQEHPLSTSDTVKFMTEETKKATAFLVYDMETLALP